MIQNYGLKPTPYDPRDFESHKLGATTLTIKDLPDNFLIDSRPVKDQSIYDFCTAFAFTEMAEEQDGFDYSEGWHFAKSKESAGDYTGWGSDIRTSGLIGAKKGFLLDKLAPYHMDKPRDFLANWKNWPESLDELALPYREMSLVRVTGSGDLFDNIRLELWKQHLQGIKTKINVGFYWREDWWWRPQGLISTTSTPRNPNNGHDVVACGWKVLNGSTYLIIKSSNGVNVGDKGYFYFPRSVVNSEAKDFGAFFYTHRSPNDMKIDQWSLIITLLDRIVKLYQRMKLGVSTLLAKLST